MNLQVKLFLKEDLLMEKVCQDWSKEAFDDKLVNASYWDEFARNAETASAEIIRVANMASAARELQRISDELGAHNILAVGGAENPALQQVYDQLAESGPTVYTDKFDIAEHAPTADLGISTAEFGVGETGSVCVDTFSYESRVTGMLPPVHVVFMNSAHTVKNVRTAFEVISRVFHQGYMGFITGPSRTADIERVLSLGVHGPGRFIILAVDEDFEGRKH